MLLKLVTMLTSLSPSTSAFLLSGAENMMLELVSSQVLMEKILKRSLEPLPAAMLSRTSCCLKKIHNEPSLLCCAIELTLPPPCECK